MAITKNIFVSKNVTSSLAEIGEWLTTNSSVLGFTVSTETDGSVICTSADGTNFLKFCNNGVSKMGVDITIANGSVLKHRSENHNCPSTWTSGYVCAEGLALFADSTSVGHYWVFIGKTKSGGLCVVYQTAYSSLDLYYCDVEKGVKIVPAYKDVSLSEICYYNANDKASVRTSFAPVCLDSEDTATSIFFTPQTQYPMVDLGKGFEKTISDGKDEYVYSGIVAMKG